MRRLYQRQGFALWILACATAAASAFTPAHAANGSALSRQVSISNLAIQSSPLLQKSYTPDGKLASLTDANNHTTSFAYDGLDRLATTTYPLGSTEMLTYDANSNVLTRKTRANQTISFTYDTLNRLKTKTPPSPAPVVSYGYDLNNRPTSLSDTSAAIPAAVPPSGPSVQYSTTAAYDALNRPTGLSWNPAPTAAAPTAGSVTFGHSYNKANQRIGQTVTDNTWLNYPAATPSTVTYAADPLNRYTTVGAVSPTYDANSNLTSDGTFTLGYDAENRLTSASSAGNTASYTYDAQGSRKTKTVNGVTTVFVTDADNREVLEYDGATGAIQRWYAYGLGSNDVLNQMNVVAGIRTTLVPDILGSVIGSMDSSSGTLSKIGYLPYGKSANALGTFGYTAQRIDPEIGGMYYYRARHYSPAWGRFLQSDPIGYAGGLNLYAYVGNDPLNLVDPSGLVVDFIGSSYGKFAQGSAYEQQTMAESYNRNPDLLAFTIASPLLATGIGAAAEAFILGSAGTVAAGAGGAAFDAIAINAARASASAAQGATGGATSGFVSEAGAVFTGASTRAGGPGMATNPAVQRALDNVAAASRSAFHGCCGEINALSNAANAGATLEGGVVATVRAVGRNAGQVLEGCSSCQAVARHLGIRIVRP